MLKTANLTKRKYVQVWGFLTSRHPHKWNDITSFFRNSGKSHPWKPLRCLSHYYVCDGTDSCMATSWYDTCMEDIHALFQRFHGCKPYFSIHATLLLHACPPSVCWHTTHILYHQLSVYVHMYAHIPLPFICTCI